MEKTQCKNRVEDLRNKNQLLKIFGIFFLYAQARSKLKKNLPYSLKTRLRKVMTGIVMGEIYERRLKPRATLSSARLFSSRLRFAVRVSPSVNIFASASTGFRSKDRLFAVYPRTNSCRVVTLNSSHAPHFLFQNIYLISVKVSMYTSDL